VGPATGMSKVNREKVAKKGTRAVRKISAKGGNEEGD